MTETSLLYNGRVKLDFDKEDHRYEVEVDGVKIKSTVGVTGVTSFLGKPALTPWAVKLCADFLESNLWTGHDTKEIDDLYKEAKRQYVKVREESAAYGTATHQWIEEFVELQLGLRDSARDPVNQSAIEFKAWYDSNHPEILFNELRVYSIDHNYAGTTDLGVRIESVGPRSIVVDTKTNNSLHAEHLIQLSAYWKALKEEKGTEAPELGGLLHLTKKGIADFLVFEPPVLEKAFECFVWLKNLQASVKKLEKLLP